MTAAAPADEGRLARGNPAARTPRRFRFGSHLAWASDAGAFRARAKLAEDLGCDTLTVPDHFRPQFACLPALMAAAAATSNIRVGPLVLGNDYKHPLVLAKELASIDVFTGGRLQVGMGAGWLREDYEGAGIPLDPPGVRVQRLEESLTVLKGLWTGQPFSFVGTHYEITEHTGTPRPVQTPHPPIMIGAGGKRMLQLAARHADIINVNVNARSGVADPTVIMQDAGNNADDINQQRIEWIREAAGDRFDDIELGAICFVIPTDDRASAVQATADQLGITEHAVLDSPQYLIGTPDEMVDDLLRRREEYGFSYMVFFDQALESVAPVIERLRGN